MVSFLQYIMRFTSATKYLVTSRYTAGTNRIESSPCSETILAVKLIKGNKQACRCAGPVIIKEKLLASRDIVVFLVANSFCFYPALATQHWLPNHAGTMQAPCRHHDSNRKLHSCPWQLIWSQFPLIAHFDCLGWTRERCEQLANSCRV